MPRPIPTPDPMKQLTIKLKTIERLIKEVNYYKSEVQENQQKLQQMKQDPNKDQYDTKKFQEVLDESHMMVPDSESRLGKAVEDLKAFRVQYLSSVEGDDSTMVGKVSEEVMEQVHKYCDMY